MALWMVLPATRALRGADTVLQTAQQAGLSGPMWMYPPVEPGQGWEVSENKRDWPTRHDAISVNPDTGSITDRVNFVAWPFFAKLTDWAIDAHMGVLFGLANQIVLALTAIGLITIVLRGYLMWWQRRPSADRRGRSGVHRCVAASAIFH
jgi:uncharacterized iron-regulated membrane protein